MSSEGLRLVLASASPRRLELLAQLGLHPEVCALDVPEQRQNGESVQAYSQRVALDKARAGFERLGRSPQLRVLGADTEVVLEDRLLGKPRDAEDALEMLQALRGRVHQVLSSVAIIGADYQDVLTQVSAVRFGAPDDARLRQYVESGECFGKAGAYAIQGRAAAFIANLEGSFSGVMGLPLFETAEMLRRAGVDFWEGTEKEGTRARGHEGT